MTKDNLKEYFSMDEALVNKFHLRSGEGLEICTEDTWNVIKDLELHQNDYGYFGIDRKDNNMVGFFIKPEMRNKETINRFWKDVYKEINGPFFTGVYNKNQPAIRFLSKQGKVFKQTDEYTIFYMLKGKG